MGSILHAHSQTFVGVLASLLLIIIIWSRESNFVISIIRERGLAIFCIWERLGRNLARASAKWSFLQRSSKKRLTRLNSLIEGMEVYHQESYFSKKYNLILTDDIKRRLTQLDEEIETYKEKFVIGYTVKIMPMIDRKISSIEKSKKIIVSAIFALMSSLLIFVLDETMSIFPMSCDFCASFLLIFLILSSAFWIGMWGAFFIRHLPRISESDFQDEEHNKENWLERASSLKLLCTLILWYIGCSFAADILDSLCMKRFLLFVVGMILPSLLIGIVKMKCRDYKEEYPYSFAINHFINFCILSSCWTLIVFFGSKNFDGFTELLYVFDSWNPLLLYVETFLLCVGVIFPILIPYLNTYILQWYMYLKMYQPTSRIRKDPRWNEIEREIGLLYNSAILS